MSEMLEVLGAILKDWMPILLRGWGRDRIYDQIPLKIWYTVI